ncbi:MAG: flagellar hook-length control protein [Sulfurimonas sp. RIFOXYD2_FULL_37_8]|nr:MAG: flagellar hook-length control protein [Sulfurimonas sp. RIFOXYD2_FULL_37_8]
MILLDMKNSKTVSSPLNLSASKDKPLLSFSDLLRGASEKKEGKTIQNGSLVLALGSEEKSIKSAKSLLKTDNLASLIVSSDEEQELLELNPKFASNLTSSEMRTLISDAKNYLKDIIQNSDGYKKAEIKELPKTLGGLIEAAKKFGIDIGKISIEEVKKSSQVTIQVAKTDKGGAADFSSSDEASLKETTNIKSEVLSKEMAQDKKAQHASEKQIPTNQQITQTRNDEKVGEAQKETPLFKAQTVSEHTTTEQIVQAKANNLSKADQKTSKDKSDESLKLLLSDEKSSQNTISAVSDSSALKVAPAAATQENTKTLEQLLRGESFISEQSQQDAKVEALSTHKADSFEVKVNEAKQMIRYLSDDIKNAIDEYKSPFTRVKVQLNPAHLGEIDLTIVQRGKNLHVNLSSNNAAINTLIMNSNELRVQLNNSGINNATLNFSDTSQQGGYADNQNSGAEQQKRQNEQKAHTEYSYFENEEAHEEILSSLEIVVPRYI